LTVVLRPVGPDDEPFLRRVYRSTREPELDLTGWDEAEKDAFVGMQFDAQDHHYRQHYTGVSYDVILVDGEPAGRLYVARWPQELRVMDIALLPPFRGRGVGSMLLGTLLEEAAAGDKVVTVHVEQFNPARRLYQRLGFHSISTEGIYELMEWRSCRPAPQVNTAS
jgi:ribosomal protein S18 acetylase RimI-like enzyme